MLDTQPYLDVDARRAELGLTFPEGMVFLPRRFAQAVDPAELMNETDSLDLGKLLHEQGVDAGLPKLDGEPLPLIVESDAFVHLPEILLGAATTASVTILLNVISSYVYDRLVGTFARPQVKLAVVAKGNDGGYRRISYEGPVEGLETLRDAIEHVSNGDD